MTVGHGGRARKSVLLLGNYPPPSGGVPRHLEYLAPFLASRGWDVHILSAGGSGSARGEGFTVHKPPRFERAFALRRAARLWRGSAFPHRLLVENAPRRWLAYMAYAAVGRKIVEANGTSIISAYNLYATGPIGALLSDTYRIPLVLSNFGELYSMTEFFRKHLPLVHYTTRAAKALLSCSRHCAQGYGLLGLAPAVEVIPYGVDVHRFVPRPDSGAVRRRLRLPEADPVVLFVGRMIRDMGLHTVLEAVPRVLQRRPKAQFLIVGTSGELLQRAREMARHQPIRVVPDVPFHELPEYYAAATVAVVPTLGDRACSSLAAMEAMASGVPVVGAAIGGIPELVEDGASGILVPPDNPSALSDGILRLLQDESLRRHLARSGRQVVETEFNQDRTNASVEAVFQRLLDLSGPAPPPATAP